MTDLARLVVRLEAESSKLHAELDKANRKLAGFERSASNVSANLKKAFVAVAAAISVGEIVGGIRDIVDEADKLSKLSQSVGVATDELSKLGYAADLSGVPMEALSTALKRVSINAADTARGTGDAKYAFDALGLSVKDIDGNLKGSSRLLTEVANKFAGMEDGAGKTAIAMKLFGKAGADLIPLLNLGAEGIENLKTEAEQLGIVIDTETGLAAEEFNDNLTRLGTAARGLRTSIVQDLLPGLVEVTTAMALAAKEGGLLEAAWVGLGGLGAYLFTDEFDSDVEKLKDLRQHLSDLQRHLKDSDGQGLIHKWIYGDALDINSEIDETVAKIAELQEKMAGGGLAAPTPKKEAAPELVDLAAQARKQQKEFDDAFKEIDKAIEESGRQVAKESEEYARWNEEMERAAQNLREQINPMEALETELTRLQVLFDGGFIDFDTYSEAVFNAMEETTDTVEDSTNEMSEFAKQAAANMQDAFADFLFDPFEKGVEGMVESFANALLRMAANAAAAKVFDMIGGIGADLGIPGFATGTSFAPGGLAMVGEYGPELVNLPRGSRVTPTSGIGGTQVNVINNTQHQATVSKSNDSSGREVVNVIIGEVAASIAQGGTIGQAIQSTFGVSRKGVVRS